MMKKSMRRHAGGILLILLLIAPCCQVQAQDLTRYVNTLQGTNSKREFSHGNTYPTTALPWGMNFWTPQTGHNRDGWIYQYERDKMRGFRQTHQCSPWTNDYSAFALMPITGKLEPGQHQRESAFSHENETAKPHYYKVAFDNGIVTEMSPTERGVHFRFKFPKTGDAYVVVDANNGGSMVKIFPKERKIIGYCKNTVPSVPKGFANYFVIQFDKDFTAQGTWKNNEGIVNKGALQAEDDYVGAYIQFKQGETVQAKVASSFISMEQAALTLQQELGNYRQLEQTKEAAQKIWNTHLGKIQLEGGTEEQKATFYSCFFRSMLFPRKFYEYNAEGKPIYYSPYDGQIHQGEMFTDNGFWDTFRSQFPLNALLHPDFHGRYVKSLIDAYDQSGWLPSWSFPGHSGGMIGNHAFSLLADAWAKGFRTFDPNRALEAMLHDATNKPSFGNSIGRGGWKDYFTLGFVPTQTNGEATSKTLEYSYNDWCAMQLAKQTNKQFYVDVFERQVTNYKNVYDPGTRFMRGRLANGSWAPNFNPLAWGGAFIEGSAWHYHWSVFHDIQGLVNLMGGERNFIAKADSVFTMTNQFDVGTYGHVIHEMAEMEAINMGQYAHGNQPIQHFFYLFNYVGQPWKSQYLSRKIMAELYNSGPNGYCGDEDQGQTSAWYVISAMGLYSVCPGTTEYVVGSPLFPKMTILLENGKKLVIEALNNTDKNVYIQSAQLNGKPFTQNYLQYEDLMNGGLVQFTMGDQPALDRGTKKEDRPYSYSK